jgi:hypothetical protein
MKEKSISGELNKTEWKAYLVNCLKFTFPCLAIFFSELALRVDWRIALATASYTLYANLSDYFGKKNQGV